MGLHSLACLVVVIAVVVPGALGFFTIREHSFSLDRHRIGIEGKALDGLPPHVYTVCDLARTEDTTLFGVEVELDIPHGAYESVTWTATLDRFACHLTVFETNPVYMLECSGIYDEYYNGLDIFSLMLEDWDNTGVIAIEFFITGVHPNGTEMTRSFVPEFVMPSFDSVSSSARGLPGDPATRVTVEVSDGGHNLQWGSTGGCFYPFVGDVPALIDVDQLSNGTISFFTWESHTNQVQFVLDSGTLPHLVTVRLRIILPETPLEFQPTCVSMQEFVQASDSIEAELLSGAGVLPCYPYQGVPTVAQFYEGISGKLYVGHVAADRVNVELGGGTDVFHDRVAYKSQLETFRECCRQCGTDGCPPQFYRDGLGCCRPTIYFFSADESVQTSTVIVDPLTQDQWCSAGRFMDVEAALSYTASTNALPPPSCIKCPEGLFTPTWNRWSRCIPCPDGYRCTNGTVIVPLFAAPTYCEFPTPTTVPTDFNDPFFFSFNDTEMASVQSHTMARCAWDLACPVGEGECGVCNEGYAEFLCGNCAPGYFKFENSCVECPNNPSLVTALMGMLVVVTLVVIGIGACRDPALANPLVSTGLIATSHVQVLAVYLAFDISWPPRVLAFIRRFAIFSFNIDLVVMGPSCVTSTQESHPFDLGQPFAKVITYAFLIPVTALVVVGIIMLVSLCCRGGRFKKVVWWQYRFFLLFFSFSYIFIAARTLEPFDCETLPSDTIGANGTVSSASGSDAGVRTLGAYPSVQCTLDSDTSEYLLMVMAGVFGLAMWGIIIPVVLFVLLWRKRKRLQDEDVMKKYGPLFSKYKDRDYLFEFVHLAKKLFLAAVAILVLKRSATQLVVSLVGLAAFNLYFLWQRPYTETALNVLYGSLGIVEFFVLVGGFAFRHVDRTDNIEDLYTGSASETPAARTTGLGAAVDILLVALLVVAMCLVVGVVVYLAWRKFCRATDPAEEDNPDKAEGVHGAAAMTKEPATAEAANSTSSSSTTSATSSSTSSSSTSSDGSTSSTTNSDSSGGDNEAILGNANVAAAQSATAAIAAV